MRIPFLGIVANVLFRFQYVLYNRWPELTDRASNFLLLGGLTSLVQVGLFLLLKNYGIATLKASLFAVEVSILLSFVANANITWSDRLNGAQLRIYEFVGLLFLFNLTHPALYILGVGIDRIESWLKVPFLAAWCICQVTAILVGFKISDEILFGSILKIFRKQKTIVPA